MHVTVLTIFPELFGPFLATSLIGRARERGLLTLEVRDLREWGEGRHRTVDDVPYGGGGGMVMTAPPWIRAVREVAGGRRPWRVLLSPQGARLDEAGVRGLAGRDELVLLCGRYEGIDERVRESGLVDEEVWLGDVVLSGGEAAALALLEAVSRFVPGVVGEEDSVRLDSFEDGLLDHPHYTRPREFRGLAVPEPLLSGHHERIRRWRREQQFEQTARHRPDLLDRFVPRTPEDRELLDRVARRGRTP